MPVAMIRPVALLADSHGHHRGDIATFCIVHESWVRALIDLIEAEVMDETSRHAAEAQR